MLRDYGKGKQAITLLEDRPYDGKRRLDIVMNLAQYYLEENGYDDCINLLTSVPYFLGRLACYHLKNKDTN